MVFAIEKDLYVCNKNTPFCPASKKKKKKKSIIVPIVCPLVGHDGLRLWKAWLPLAVLRQL